MHEVINSLKTVEELHAYTAARVAILKASFCDHEGDIEEYPDGDMITFKCPCGHVLEHRKI